MLPPGHLGTTPLQRAISHIGRHWLVEEDESTERCQLPIRERLLDLRHPVFDGPIHSKRHLAGDNLDKLS